MSASVIVAVTGVLSFACSLTWWVVLERRKDASRQAGSDALGAGDLDAARDALEEYGRLLVEQRWPSALGTLTCVAVGVFFGHYFAVGG